MKVRSLEWWLELGGLLVLVANLPVQNMWVEGTGLAILVASTVMDGIGHATHRE